MLKEYFIGFFNHIPKVGLAVLSFGLFTVQQVIAQPEWPDNKKCAVCLTYDDGIDIDLDNVIPALDSLGFKGTFYVPGNSTSLYKRMEEWEKITKNGHELGNHTMFHPCFGKSMKRDWVSPDYDLDTYSMSRMVGEIEAENTLLKAIDGKTKRTFAYTCGDQVINGDSIWTHIKTDFVAARGVNQELPTINEINYANIGSYMADGQTGDELIAWVKEAMAKNSLIVFLFHGVGGGHNINVSLEAHSKLLHFLKENEKDIWVAPFIDVAEYAKSIQKEKK